MFGLRQANGFLQTLGQISTQSVNQILLLQQQAICKERYILRFAILSNAIDCCTWTHILTYILPFQIRRQMLFCSHTHQVPLQYASMLCCINSYFWAFFLANNIRIGDTFVFSDTVTVILYVVYCIRFHIIVCCFAFIQIEMNITIHFSFWFDEQVQGET